MQLLSFNGIGLQKFQLSVFGLLFFMGMSLALGWVGTLTDYASSSGIASAICGILSLGPWYWIMTRISNSLVDEVIEKRIHWIFIPILISSVLTILSYISLCDWLLLIAGIIELIGLSFYLSIGVRCIRYGDKNVRKFGNLLVYVSFLLSFVILCITVVLFVVFEGDRIIYRFITPSSLIIATCFVNPLQYALGTIKNKGMEKNGSHDMTCVMTQNDICDSVTSATYKSKHSQGNSMDAAEPKRPELLKKILVIIGVAIVTVITIVILYRFHDDSNPTLTNNDDSNSTLTNDALTEEEIIGDDILTESNHNNETNLVEAILNKADKMVDGLNVRFFKGEFINGSSRYPIMLAFCESPNDIGHICGIAYKNLSQGTILDLEGLFLVTSMKLTGYDGHTELEILLSGVKDDGRIIYGHATYGNLTTSVEIWSTDDTFTLPKSIKMLGSQNLPSWLNPSILKSFGKPDLKMMPYNFMKDNLFRAMSVGCGESGRFEGMINEDKIVMDMKVDYDGKVSGQYCHKGDGESRWVTFHGDVLMDSSYQAYVILEAEHLDSRSDKQYEYILLKFEPFDRWTGKSFNNIDKDMDSQPRFNTFMIYPPENE